MHKTSRIFVAGRAGLAGSAIARQLALAGYSQVIGPTRAQVDLCDRVQVDAFFAAEAPEYVILAAARVGGIEANRRYPAEFIYQNLAIQTNVIDAAWRFGVKKLLFLGSSCIYPRDAPQPIREEYLMTGSLEETNQAYAVAKIAGITMARAYRNQYGFPAICIMPTNLYGPGDRYDIDNSHVVPALLRKFHEARVKNLPDVTVWGTGTPRREFLFVDDLAKAAVFLLEEYDGEELINVGTGEDITIAELVRMIANTIGYRGNIIWDHSKPDGTPRKLLDVSKVNALGWRATTSLAAGLQATYDWCVAREEWATPAPVALGLNSRAHR